MGFLTRYSRTTATAIIIGAISVLSAGCAAAIPVLTKIAAVVTNARIVLDIIDGGAREWFRTHPNVPEQTIAEYEKLYAKSLLALDAAAQAVAGSTDLSQDEYDAAFAEFKQAYINLVNLLHKEGIARDNTMGTADGSTVELPEPLAMTYMIE